MRYRSIFPRAVRYSLLTATVICGISGSGLTVFLLIGYDQFILDDHFVFYFAGIIGAYLLSAVLGWLLFSFRASSDDAPPEE